MPAAGGSVWLTNRENGDIDTRSGIELGEFTDEILCLAFTRAGADTLQTVGLLYHSVLSCASDSFVIWATSGLADATLATMLAGSAVFKACFDGGATGGSTACVVMLQDHTRAELVGY